MKKIATKLALTCIIALLAPVAALAQQQSPEEIEKQIRESIDRQVENLTERLELDPGQEFFVDSILTYNNFEAYKEGTALSKSKVSNVDIYYRVQDSWAEKTYQAMRKVLDEEQWAKYLKMGAARDKKARDKREAKRNQ